MMQKRNTLFLAGASAALLNATPLVAQDAAGEPDPTKTMEWHSEQQAYPTGLKTADGWHFVQGGLRWRWLEYNGSDTNASISDTITIHYEGKLLDGTVFDSSYERGEPATFPLGRLIEGWKLAIPKMGLGETIEIVIPSDLAYGPSGGGPIPGGATLIFKVKLIAIEGQ